MSIAIKENDLKGFIKAGRKTQNSKSKKIHFLDSDIKRFLSLKNPLFQKGRGDRTYFTAYKNGEAVGRICAHVHRASNKKFNEKRGCFGFFECIDDLDTAKMLFNSAELYLKRNGCNLISGNFNLTAMQKMGIMTDNFNLSPYTDQLYSQDYYVNLLEKCGYQRYFPMTTFEITTSDWDLNKFKTEKTTKLSLDPDVELIPIDKKNMKESLEITRKLLNDGFEHNPMFVAVSKDEFDYQAKDMARIIDTRIAKLMKYKGEPAAVMIAIPDIDNLLAVTQSRINLKFLFKFLSFKKNNDRAVIIFYSVAKKFHNLGLNSYLLQQFTQSATDAGYKKIGGTWIADVNAASLRQKEKLIGKNLHRLHLFKKEI